MQTFTSVIGPVEWEANDAILTIAMAGRVHLLAWNEIGGAGIVLLPQGDDASAPVGRHLVIAPGAGKEYLLRIPLPAENPHGPSMRGVDPDEVARAATDERPLTTDAALANDLVETVRERLGDRRWHTDLLPDTYRKVLVPPWSNLPEWVMPTAVLGFVGLSGIFLMLCMVVSMAGAGEWEVVWWQVGVGLAIWLVIVTGILGVYRRLWIR